MWRVILNILGIILIPGIRLLSIWSRSGFFYTLNSMICTKTYDCIFWKQELFIFPKIILIAMGISIIVSTFSLPYCGARLGITLITHTMYNSYACRHWCWAVFLVMGDAKGSIMKQYETKVPISTHWETTLVTILSSSVDYQYCTDRGCW